MQVSWRQFFKPTTTYDQSKDQAPLECEELGSSGAHGEYRHAHLMCVEHDRKPEGGSPLLSLVTAKPASPNRAAAKSGAAKSGMAWWPKPPDSLWAVVASNSRAAAVALPTDFFVKIRLVSLAPANTG